MYRKKEEFDLLKAWKAALEAGTAVCRGGCGDRPTRLKPDGVKPGTYCAGCLREVVHGHVPPLDWPRGTRRRR